MLNNFEFIYQEWLLDFKKIYNENLRGVITKQTASKYFDLLTENSSRKMGEAYVSFRSMLVEVREGVRPMNVALFNSTLFSLAYGIKVK